MNIRMHGATNKKNLYTQGVLYGQQSGQRSPKRTLWFLKNIQVIFLPRLVESVSSMGLHMCYDPYCALLIYDIVQSGRSIFRKT